MPTPTDLFGGAGTGVQLGSGFFNVFRDVKDQFVDNVSGRMPYTRRCCWALGYITAPRRRACSYALLCISNECMSSWHGHIWQGQSCSCM